MSVKTAAAPPLKKMGLGRFVVDDFRASLVVFLVALPLSLGVAVASGVPPALGLITAIVGGIVVGALPGSTFVVSGSDLADERGRVLDSEQLAAVASGDGDDRDRDH